MDRQQAEQFMLEAVKEAESAAAAGEVPVGAVLVRDGVIIARARNRVEADHDATAHAEMLVIREAARQSGEWRLTDSALFVTLEPCPMCMTAMVLARVSELFFGARDPRMGASGSRFDLSSYPGFPHRLQVCPDILSDRCEALLREFFSKLR